MTSTGGATTNKAVGGAVQEIAACLAKNLTYYYKETNPNEANLQEWIQMALEPHHNDLLQLLQQGSKNNNNDTLPLNLNALVEQAMSFALEEYRASRSLDHDSTDKGSSQTNNKPNTTSDGTTAAAAKSSFSLLDQLIGASGSGGSLLMAAPFFSWDDVRENTPEEQYKALNDIQFMDDILPDWDNGLCQHLQQGLVIASTTTTAMTNNGFDTTTTTTTTHTRYQKLHAKWFGLCRKSVEYAMLCVDLANNVLQAHLLAKTRKNDDDNDDDVCRNLLSLWLEMWLDIMMRGTTTGHSNGVDNRKMFRTVWNFMVQGTDDDDDESQAKTTQSRRLLIELDPHGRWAHAWMRLHMTSSLMATKAVEDDDVVDVSIILVPWIRQARQLDLAHLVYVLSLCHALLLTCRVALFPWNLIPGTTGKRSESILDMIDLFLYLLSILKNDKDKDSGETMSICTESVDILMAGCRHQEEELFQSLRERVEAFVVDRNNNETARSALQEVLSGYE